MHMHVNRERGNRSQRGKHCRVTHRLNLKGVFVDLTMINMYLCILWGCQGHL